MGDGISFAGDGMKDVSNMPTNTQPSVSKSGSGPIDFVGNGNADCSGVINTAGKESMPSGGDVKFVADI